MIRTPRLPRLDLAPAATAFALCAGIGAAMSLRAEYAPLLIAGVTAVLLSLRWRVGVIVLLVVLPFSGVPAFLGGTGGLAMRDLCIVGPLYVAFAVDMTRSRERLLPEIGSAALAALALFAMLVVTQALRSPTVLAGTIGARVWLAYVPMLAIGYHFVRTSGELETMLKITALLGLIPAALALGESWYAVTQGDFGPFERIYGAWQLTDTQRFVVFTTADGHLRIPRVPSTFTGVSQYFSFSLVAFAAGLSMTLRTGGARWGACTALLAAGAFASGARAAYVAVPAIALVSLALSGVWPDRRAAITGIVMGAIVAASSIAIALVLRPELLHVATALPAHAGVTLANAVGEMRASFTLFGHGTGWDTNAALRYGGVTERRYIENWYAKAMLELGAGGLIAILIAFAGIGASMLRALPQLDAQSRRLAAPVCALLAVTALLLVKGPYIDLDPLNVYAWLLLGALFGLARTASVDGGGA